MDLKAFDVLSADIDNKIDVGEKRTGGFEMGHCFNQTEIHAKRVPDQILAVTGDRAGEDIPGGIFGPQIPDKIKHMGNRIALIALIAGQQQLTVTGDDHGLDGGGTGINAQIHIAGIGVRIKNRHL